MGKKLLSLFSNLCWGLFWFFFTRYYDKLEAPVSQFIASYWGLIIGWLVINVFWLIVWWVESNKRQKLEKENRQLNVDKQPLSKELDVKNRAEIEQKKYGDYPPDFPLRSAVNYIKDKTVFGAENDWQSIVYEIEQLTKNGQIRIWAKHDLDGDFIELFPPKLRKDGAHFECQRNTIQATIRFFKTETFMIDIHLSKKEVEKFFAKKFKKY